MNTCILSIFDTSVYSELIPVSCPLLTITVPGFAYSVQIPVSPNFNETIGS